MCSFIFSAEPFIADLRVHCAYDRNVNILVRLAAVIFLTEKDVLISILFACISSDNFYWTLLFFECVLSNFIDVSCSRKYLCRRNVSTLSI